MISGMFDPPDYPYKDITESFKDYGTEDLLYGDCASSQNVINIGETKHPMEDKILYPNDNGQFFVSASTIHENHTPKFTNDNTELLIIQTDSLINYEPTLLDDKTVNQFLLPVQVNTEKEQEENNTPDLLALQACVICHEIFTTDSDLLDHTIYAHASNSQIDKTQNLLQSSSNAEVKVPSSDTINNNVVDLETEWLVCCLCERILSMALEVEPTDQLCCIDSAGESKVMNRRLQTMYVCDFCNSLFADVKSLDKHKTTCNKDNDECYVDQSSTSSLLESPRSHNDTPGMQIQPPNGSKSFEKNNRSRGEKIYPATNGSNKMWNCGSCNQLFATARELYRHKRGEDRPAGVPLTAYVCDECDKVLGSMCALHTHRKMHKVTKPGYPCRICGRRFNQSGHLAIHMRMHTGERPYPCDLCPKAFKVKVERDDHRRTHTGERPFACTACPKTFTAAARLREHARIHTDQRPYRCEICGAAFRRPYARTVHTLIHTGEKPHECDICGTAFRRSGDMWKHKRTIHGTQLATHDGKTA